MAFVARSSYKFTRSVYTNSGASLHVLEAGGEMVEWRREGTGANALVDDRVSFNFRVARAVAILLVFTGHFGTGIAFFWVPVSIGLFVFGFSSAYFTSAKYHGRFQMAAYWKKKLYRLGPKLLVTDLFLLVLFILRGESGILTWQTPVNLLGLTGFLNWMHLANPSPFGAGLWFFTLLLLFYAVYPVLRKLAWSQAALGFVTCLGLVGAVVLNRYVVVGHALWFTAWSFIFGVLVQRVSLKLRPVLGAVTVIVSAAAMLVLNLVLEFKALNFVLIVVASVGTVFWLKDARLPRRLFGPVATVFGSTLEIYFVHSYLFLRLTGRPILDYVVSLICVVVVAWPLNRAASAISDLATRRRPVENLCAGSPGNRCTREDIDEAAERRDPFETGH